MNLKDVKIPSSWKEVTIGQFIELVQVEGDSFQSAIERISILLNVDTEEVKKLSLEDREAIADKLLFTLTLPELDSYKERFEIDGVKYAMINLNKVTLGEWVDLENLISGGAYKNLHKILAILYREVLYDTPEIDLLSVKEYNTEESLKNSILFAEKLNVELVFGACLFFSLFASRLALTTLWSLEEEMKETMTK